MNFNIEFPIKTPDFQLRLEDRFFFAGSCFAENMASTMNELLLNQEFLKHGILFNPISLFNAFQQIIHQTIPEENSIIEKNGIFLSWNHHGLVYNISKQKLKELIIENNVYQKQSIEQANCLIISFGTAFVYELIEQNLVVANCHKVPYKAFNKRLLSSVEIIQSWEKCIAELQSLNPGLKIILTVSPVKYLKDGVHENNLSKATLLLAVHELSKISNCYYFPAFEILQDELRDYRFYANDMAHPNEQAIQYIWEKFTQNCFNVQSQDSLKELEKFNLMISHRIIHEGSNEHHLFLQNLGNKEKELQLKYPFLNW